MAHKILPRPSFVDQCKFIKVIGNTKVWQSLDGKRYYTWDQLHGDLEVFNKRGVHLASADALTGKYIKPAVKGRKLDV